MIKDFKSLHHITNMVSKLNQKIKFRNDNIFRTGLKPFIKGKCKTKRKFSLRIKLINNVLKLLSFTIEVIWWISKVFGPSELVPEDLENIQKSLRDVLLHRGVPGFVTFIKNVRGAFSAAIAGEHEKRKRFGIKVYFDGIPKCFGTSLASKVRISLIPGNSKVTLRLINTLLCCTRALSIGVIVKTSTITEPPKETSCNIARYTWDFWRALGYPKTFRSDIPESLRFKSYHFTTKSGPNGHALWSSIVDFTALDSNLRADIEYIGGDKIQSHFKKLDILLPYLKKMTFLFTQLKDPKLRKLVSFPEKEDKVRVVALLDYFSQTVLRPLHLHLFKVLRKIPQDCTFEQESFIEKIKDWEYFCSADLSAATDRFPLTLICEVLKGHLSVEYVNAFSRILVDRPFHYGEEKLTYKTGNPMGAYASWSSFTISHHYVIYYCCRKLNINWHTAKYCMLGDDIVIGDERLATLYIEVMTELGVEINMAKTHKSKYFCEFAKRLILHGEEITPFPISSLKESQKYYYTLVALFVDLETKGYKCIDGIVASVDSYYEFLRPISSKTRAKWREKAYFCEHMMKIMRGTISANEGINSLIRQFGYQIRELSEEECEGILSNIAVEAFADSNPENRSSQKTNAPVGVFALMIQMNLECLKYEPLWCFDKDFSCIPLFSSSKKLMNDAKTLTERAYQIDTIEKGNWPKEFNSFCLPLTNEVFFKRTIEPIDRSSATMGSHMKYRLDILQTPMGKAMLG